MTDLNLGNWQRVILRGLAHAGGLWLNDLLEPGYPEHEYRALHRAATTLADNGRIKATLKKEGTRHARLWITRGRRKLPDLPPSHYVLARVRVPDMPKEG